jgi:hypothetical protein
MSLSTRTMLHRHTTGLWICLSLITLTLLLLILAGALAGTAIRAGHMLPPQGIVRFGPVTLTAEVVDCPHFPRCIGHGWHGVPATPVPFQWPFQYIVVVRLTSPAGQAVYRIFDVVVEGEVVGIVTPDY